MARTKINQNQKDDSSLNSMKQCTVVHHLMILKVWEATIAIDGTSNLRIGPNPRAISLRQEMIH